ncbi:MAG: hypothetical protein V4568_17065 [Pseudomonadota bacterium]
MPEDETPSPVIHLEKVMKKLLAVLAVALITPVAFAQNASTTTNTTTPAAATTSATDTNAPAKPANNKKAHKKHHHQKKESKATTPAEVTPATK